MLSYGFARKFNRLNAVEKMNRAGRSVPEIAAAVGMTQKCVFDYIVNAEFGGTDFRVTERPLPSPRDIAAAFAEAAA
jgi:hypothetical protein